MAAAASPVKFRRLVLGKLVIFLLQNLREPLSLSLSGFFPRPFRCLVAPCPRRRAPAAAGELLLVEDDLARGPWGARGPGMELGRAPRAQRGRALCVVVSDASELQVDYLRMFGIGTK